LLANKTAVAGAGGRINQNVKCFKCQKWGHYVDNCPESNGNGNRNGTQHFQQNNSKEIEEDEDSEPELTDDKRSDPKVSFQHMMVAFMTDGDNNDFTENDMNTILLDDTGSNISVFNNRKLLTNVRASRFTQSVFANGGHQYSEYVGHLEGFFDVWYNPESRVNILSFADVARKFRITMDTESESAIYVRISKQQVIKFNEVKNGLYVLHVNPLKPKNSIISYLTYFTTVEENKNNFTKREIEGANRARRLYWHINMPGNDYFLHLVEPNFFRNSPVTPDDVKRAIAIYGPDITFLKGRSVRKRPMLIQTIQTVAIPKTIKEHHSNVIVSIDHLIVQ